MSRKLIIAIFAAAILIVGALAIPRIYAAVTTPQPILEEESCAIMPLDADPETYVPSCTGKPHELDLEALMPTFGNDPFGSE